MKFLIYLFPFFLFALRNEPITPIPQTIHYDNKKAELGKKLFFDTSFSKDKKISCASCHSPLFYGADPRKVSIGVFNKKGIIQSPTVYNSIYNFRQFWNGRAKNLEEQIDGPIHNPVEMGINERIVVNILNKKYKVQFYKIYNTYNIKYYMFKDVIAEFEKSLITPNCKFDKWLRNEIKLTKLEKDGYFNFKKLGCITCHNGINVGGNSFQKIGVIHKIDNRIGDRFSFTKKEEDKYLYKVPSLRNIAKTAPYFHTGEENNLSKAISLMAYYNLGLNLTDYQIKSIRAFLETLSGETPKILDRIK